MCIERISDCLPTIKKISTFTYEYSNYIPAAIAVISIFADLYASNKYKYTGFAKILGCVAVSFYLLKFCINFFGDKKHDDLLIRKKIELQLGGIFTYPMINDLGIKVNDVSVWFAKSLFEKADCITTENLNDIIGDTLDIASDSTRFIAAENLVVGSSYVSNLKKYADFAGKMAAIFSNGCLLYEFWETGFGKDLLQADEESITSLFAPIFGEEEEIEFDAGENGRAIINSTFVFLLNEFVLSKKIADKFTRDAAIKLVEKFKGKSIHIPSSHNSFQSVDIEITDLFKESEHWKDKLQHWQDDSWK